MHLTQFLGSIHNMAPTYRMCSYLLIVINVMTNKTHFQEWLFVITQFPDEQITQRKTALMRFRSIFSTEKSKRTRNYYFTKQMSIQSPHN